MLFYLQKVCKYSLDQNLQSQLCIFQYIQLPFVDAVAGLPFYNYWEPKFYKHGICCLHLNLCPMHSILSSQCLQYILVKLKNSKQIDQKMFCKEGLNCTNYTGRTNSKCFCIYLDEIYASPNIRRGICGFSTRRNILSIDIWLYHNYFIL